MKGNTILNTKVLEPYAQALLSLGQSNNLVDAFGDDARLILETVNSSDELQTFLESPFGGDDAKKAVLKQIFGGKIQPFMENFIMILVDRRRIMFLAGICQQYQVLMRQLKGIVLAEVRSAVELNDAQKEQIKQRVKTVTSANEVEIASEIDPDLIGGVVIKAGSQVIDASLKGQLRQISLRLAGLA
ncbi:F0F1 ATP synthase subunit delta [filamentous cyanobacterium LEGE 11480]|uniref:ATP synthase subunit delta n=1 Tax=Romeriopsis navalis LEGE 11480 TaxID=2777977 RepID=A0A928Z4M4_9CYAN|nr:ATP synthase F1 subunit delta [Romeriopsis navalis]MBE9032776.1 F0F1 ATP synthase subunit delta [Romeriopsis navalis LEGE 11480]